MSFLKQLLTPFIEFDANNPQGQQKAPATPAPQQQGAAPQKQPSKPQQPSPVTQPKQPPVQQPKAATPPLPPKPAAPVPPPINEPVHHPMIDTPVSNVPATVPVFSPSGTLVEPLPEHVQYFEKLIDNANRNHPPFRGTDYKEFVDSKVDIDDITDEALKYKTAYNVLKSTGLTVEKLLATGQEYINLIGRDMNAFQGAHSLKYQKEVRQREALIQKKAEELQALVQRMNALKAEINQLTQDINLTKDQLNITRNSFLLAGEAKQKEIETELQKIAHYF